MCGVDYIFLFFLCGIESEKYKFFSENKTFGGTEWKN